MSKNNNKASETKNQDNKNLKFQEEFKKLTDGIQTILDLGSESLSQAEKKTEILSKMQEGTKEYEDLVIEIKHDQKIAGEAFSKAEELIKSANEILPSKK